MTSEGSGEEIPIDYTYLNSNTNLWVLVSMGVTDKGLISDASLSLSPAILLKDRMDDYEDLMISLHFNYHLE